jgi:hypothetical protein
MNNKNLHLDNKQHIHVSSKNHEENNQTLDMDLLIISYLSRVSYFEKWANQKTGNPVRPISIGSQGPCRTKLLIICGLQVTLLCRWDFPFGPQPYEWLGSHTPPCLEKTLAALYTAHSMFQPPFNSSVAIIASTSLWRHNFTSFSSLDVPISGYFFHVLQCPGSFWA